jgi:hypothetical protein
LHLVVVVRVVDDDYLAVTRRPEDVETEVAKKLCDEFLIMRSVSNQRRRALTGVAPEALPCSNNDEQRRRDETSDGDSGGVGDPDGIGVRVFASSGRGLPSAEGECSRLTSFLSSIGG